MNTLYTWNPEKRLSNLLKHDLDFADAWRVFEARGKLTLEVIREGEARRQDIAMVEGMLLVLTLVYVERGDFVRVISLRRASKKERRMYYEWQDDF